MHHPTERIAHTMNLETQSWNTGWNNEFTLRYRSSNSSHQEQIHIARNWWTESLLMLTFWLSKLDKWLICNERCPWLTTYFQAWHTTALVTPAVSTTLAGMRKVSRESLWQPITSLKAGVSTSDSLVKDKKHRIVHWTKDLGFLIALRHWCCHVY